MKKSVLIAALGLFSLNTMAQDAPKEEEMCIRDRAYTSVTAFPLRPMP